MIARRARLTSWLLDGIERLVVTALYGWLVVSIVRAAIATGSWANLLLLASEGLVVAFILCRRGTDEVSRHPRDWMLALLATAAPLLARPGGTPLMPPVVGALVVLLGTFVQLHAKLVLGRSMGMVPANRGIKLSGPYRHLRHPMYAGYLLSDIGFLMMNPTPRNAALYCLFILLQVPRLLYEERLLARDPQYRAYVDAVPYRLIPWLF